MKKSRVKFTLLFLVFSPGLSSTLRFRYLSLSILFCCEFVDILTFLFIWFFAHLTWRKQCELEKRIITIFVDMFSLQPGRYIFSFLIARAQEGSYSLYRFAHLPTKSPTRST